MVFISERFQTRKILSHFVTNVDKMCPFCNFEEENQMHLFFNCRVTKLVWDLFFFFFGKPCKFNSNNFISVVDWLDSLKHVDKVSRVCFYVGRFGTNNMVFRNVMPFPTRSKFLAISMGEKYLKSNNKVLRKNTLMTQRLLNGIFRIRIAC